MPAHDDGATCFGGRRTKTFTIAGRCQSFRAAARRSFAAIVTKAARESAFIFRITLPRCAFTVISLMPSSNSTCFRGG